MTGPEHYAEAERLLEEFGQEVEVPLEDRAFLAAYLSAGMARAQAHAILANAAATALVMGDNGQTPLSAYDEWAQVAGIKEASR